MGDFLTASEAIGLAQQRPLISRGNLVRAQLKGDVAIVTGAGRGIGFECARSLAWLGARVIVAEIDRRTGVAAAETINREFGSGAATFIQTDVADERSVSNLARQAARQLGKVDIVINNATVFPIGAVEERPIADWDWSYRVNLRGPVMLARELVPGMRGRNHGVFIYISSVGEAYMGPYETFKAAGVHLMRVLDAELEGTDVYAFAIGPGLVHTPGADSAIPLIAPRYGKTVEEFFAMSKDHIISAEAAGAGFAAAVALARNFRGQDTSSKAALIQAGIDWEQQPQSAGDVAAMDSETAARAAALATELADIIAGQAEGWKQRPLFERQWIVRDFQRHSGMPADRWVAGLRELAERLGAGGFTGLASKEISPRKLADYFTHWYDMAKGYIKDPVQREEQLAVVNSWVEKAEELDGLVRPRSS